MIPWGPTTRRRSRPQVFIDAVFVNVWLLRLTYRIFFFRLAGMVNDLGWRERQINIPLCRNNSRRSTHTRFDGIRFYPHMIDKT